MGALRQTSSVNANLGKLQIITGLITVNSNTWTLAANNDAATLTDIGAGNVSVQFNTPFVTTPVCVVTNTNLTNQAQSLYRTYIEAISTTEVEFRVHALIDSGSGAVDLTQVDQSDTDGWNFMVIGMANN